MRWDWNADGALELRDGNKVLMAATWVRGKYTHKEYWEAKLFDKDQSMRRFKTKRLAMAGCEKAVREWLADANGPIASIG